MELFLSIRQLWRSIYIHNDNSFVWRVYEIYLLVIKMVEKKVIIYS